MSNKRKIADYELVNDISLNDVKKTIVDGKEIINKLTYGDFNGNC